MCFEVIAWKITLSVITIIVIDGERCMGNSSAAIDFLLTQSVVNLVLWAEGAGHDHRSTARNRGRADQPLREGGP